MRGLIGLCLIAFMAFVATQVRFSWSAHDLYYPLEPWYGTTSCQYRGVMLRSNPRLRITIQVTNRSNDGKVYGTKLCLP